jgi:hypothetical protein
MELCEGYLRGSQRAPEAVEVPWSIFGALRACGALMTVQAALCQLMIKADATLMPYEISGVTAGSAPRTGTCTTTRPATAPAPALAPHWSTRTGTCSAGTPALPLPRSSSRASGGSMWLSAVSAAAAVSSLPIADANSLIPSSSFWPSLIL